MLRSIAIGVTSMVAIFGVATANYDKGYEAAWQAFNLSSNGETVHLEMPSTPQVDTDGTLTMIYCSVGGNQYSAWTPNVPRAGISPDQALAMVTAIIQKNGGFVSKSSRSQQHRQSIIDLEGGISASLLTLNGRIIVTPENVFYLETLSPGGVNFHSEFTNRFSIN